MTYLSTHIPWPHGDELRAIRALPSECPLVGHSGQSAGTHSQQSLGIHDWMSLQVSNMADPCDGAGSDSVSPHDRLHAELDEIPNGLLNLLVKQLVRGQDQCDRAQDESRQHGRRNEVTLYNRAGREVEPAHSISCPTMANNRAN